MNKIITLGKDILREKSLPLETFDESTVKLINTMYKLMKKNRGIGLAAVQIGVLVKIFIIEIEDNKPLVFINPEIMKTSLEQEPYEEGCLSIPGINSDVIRPVGVKVQAWNEKARPFTIETGDLLARVIQHEYDHLEGKLFIDHVEPVKREKLLKQYQNKE